MTQVGGSISKLVVNTIAQSTSPYLLNPDYQKNFEVVELLTHNPETLPVAFKYLRQQIKNDNLEVSVLGLALLETLIKNVPACHICVADAYFMQGLVKVATGTRSQSVFKSFKRKPASRNVKIKMEQKALLIIKTCADTYNDGRSYPIFKQTYEKLRNEGVRFPEFDQNESNIIFAPDRSSADKKAADPSSNENAKDDVELDLQEKPVLQVPEKVENVTNPNLLQSQEMCVLLHQMILSNDDLKTNELVLSVVNQLRVSQNEIMSILATTNDEQAMASALAVNDLIVQILFGYEEVANGRMLREAPEKEGEESDQLENPASPLFPDLGEDGAEEEVEGVSEPGAKKKKKKKKKKVTLSPPAAASGRKKSADAKAEPGLLDDLLFSSPSDQPTHTEGKDPFLDFASQFVKQDEPASVTSGGDPFAVPSAAPGIQKSDPFANSAVTSADPFASPTQPNADPFATADPFTPQTNASPNPFDAAPKASDPFSSTNDPFTTQSSPFQQTKDPFNTPANANKSDPFSAVSNPDPFQAKDKRDPFRKTDPFASTNIFNQPANPGYVQQPQANFFNTPVQTQNMFTPPTSSFQQSAFQSSPFQPQPQQNPSPFFQQPYQPPPDPFAHIQSPNIAHGAQMAAQNQFNKPRKKLTKQHDPFKDVNPFASI